MTDDTSEMSAHKRVGPDGQQITVEAGMRWQKEWRHDSWTLSPRERLTVIACPYLFPPLSEKLKYFLEINKSTEQKEKTFGHVQSEVEIFA